MYLISHKCTCYGSRRAVPHPLALCCTRERETLEHRAKPGKSLRSKWHRAVVTVITASRREANLTQEQLAARLGWHRSTIAKIEAGERRLDVAEFITIATALKIEPAALFSRVLSW